MFDLLLQYKIGGVDSCAALQARFPLRLYKGMVVEGEDLSDV